MHIIGLVEHPDHVCCRYRLGALQPHLEANGHQLELQAIPRGLLSRLKMWWRLRDADLVILQRRLMSRWHLLLLRRYARRLIYDFDDAVFQRDSYSNKQESAIRRRRFMSSVQAADLVIAGNEYLGQEAARFTGAHQVQVVPTCVDPFAYPLADHHRRADGVQLVWIGSSSTLHGLERRRPLLDTIAEQVPGIHCRIICDRFPRFKVMPVIAVPWSQATEGQDLAAADIGISWVPDDRWSQGKCGLKLLQYMAAGLPVVANRVGVQASMIRHGENGYLADTPAQWVEAIRRLASDPALRQRMGRAGRLLVEREYSVPVAAERWLSLLFPTRQKLAA